MTTPTDRGELVRRFIIDNLEQHPRDIARVTRENFVCSRQAVHRYLQAMVEEGAIARQGQQRAKYFRMLPPLEWHKAYRPQGRVRIDKAWLEDLLPVLARLPDNLIGIWHYGFSELFANALEHSGATLISVDLEKTAASTRISLTDNGVGIFSKIQSTLQLADPRQALLELAKGRCSSDSARQRGRGIFFAAQLFDQLAIVSGGVRCTHQLAAGDGWRVEPGSSGLGTQVTLHLHNHGARLARRVFGAFSATGGNGFSKTVVPVKLARIGDELLTERAQAQRLLARLECFAGVVFDFAGVDAIGESFADEIFRAFPARHPGIEIREINAVGAVSAAIARARRPGAG